MRYERIEYEKREQTNILSKWIFFARSTSLMLLPLSSVSVNGKMLNCKSRSNENTVRENIKIILLLPLKL